jgi:chromosome segregation ATPase
MVHGGNPQILQEFEKRASDIERAKRKLENIENELVELQQKIDEIRQKWEPELDQLIGQISDAFSENFEKINCAGQVEVYKEEDDFNKWAIQIQVKFRYATARFVLVISITLTTNLQRKRTTVCP